MRVVWLCGPSGVGKSAAGFEIFARLGRAGVRAAYLDTDQISLVHPPPPDGTHHARARALAALWPVFEAAGAGWLVVSGYVDTADDVLPYGPALPAGVVRVRLRVGVADRVLHLATTPSGPRAIAGGPAGAHAHGEGGEVVWLCGARGAGVSTAGYEVFRRVLASGVRAAYVDLRQISFLGPGTGVDPAVAGQTLAALWSVHRSAGAECLVVAGPADDRDTLARYAAALPGTAVTVCRLDAGPAALAERLRLRALGQGPAIPGDDLAGRTPEEVRGWAGRAARQARDLRRAGVGDVHVDTDGLTPSRVAELVLQAAWRGSR
ncbi:hypothetical protein [Nonomuraea endophytica]|uniref:Uncharacterized protein n=1 Tax=Nonomuraea endophytica TaxID=714136 RepID=A0A7W8EKD7_9ACTN|nr:hypothetical protein [Nonomuraea endophytica]MBB5081672.1 hypothetical protein [Nonomuraea endophytica]